MFVSHQGGSGGGVALVGYRLGDETGKTPLWVVVDGFYEKGPLPQLARRLTIVGVSRLRKDVALRQATLEEESSALIGSGLIPPKNFSIAEKTAASPALISDFLAKCSLTPGA